MDTSDPEIAFDELGVCNHCRAATVSLSSKPYSLQPGDKQRQLLALVSELKRRGGGRRYDCIIGLSGGVDSSYVAVKVKELGLRPLAVHLDNGWDSELAVQNIENICRRLNIDLYTEVLDWEEFRDLQLSFLKASTPDCEIPSDHAIVAILYRIARSQRVRAVVAGTNRASESILPAAWSQGHEDWKYIRSLQRMYGTRQLKTYPHRGIVLCLWHRFTKAIEWIHILDYLDYDREAAKQILASKVGWRDYGRKHGESNYTRIYQEHILPKKFGFDKRRAHYSSLIVAGQLSRDQALRLLEQPLYSEAAKLEEDIGYLTNKLQISREEFSRILEMPPRSYWDYPSYRSAWLYRFALRFYLRRSR